MDALENLDPLNRSSVATEEPALSAPAPVQNRQSGFQQLISGLGLSGLVYSLGLMALIIPTTIFVARESWNSEQGAHGPIVLMTGLWLLWRKWPSVRQYSAPPPAWRVVVILIPLILGYMFARITQIVEIEGFLMYGSAIAAVYGLIGGKALRQMAFPLGYLAFMFPPPETVIYYLTMPMKVGISEGSVALLKLFGYPIGGTGVTIQIGQYQLLVAAACSGLNSIVSLSALTVFYIYIRHPNQTRLTLLLLLFVIPVAIAANFLRVIILILLTYYAGEAVAQSFLHELAGMTMFVISLLLIYAIDRVIGRMIGRHDDALPSQTAQEVAAS